LVGGVACHSLAGGDFVNIFLTTPRHLKATGSGQKEGKNEGCELKTRSQRAVPRWCAEPKARPSGLNVGWQKRKKKKRRSGSDGPSPSRLIEVRCWLKPLVYSIANNSHCNFLASTKVCAFATTPSAHERAFDGRRA
jgi:hypothetical protein